MRQDEGVRHQRSAATGALAAVASVALVTAVIFGLRELVPVVSTGVVYMLAVLFVSSFFGLWFGLLSALLSALAFNFFHLPPTGRFTIADGENWVALGVFLVAAAVISGLAGAARARADEAETRRAEADLTAEMARILLGGAELEDSLRTAGQRIASAFGLASVGVELAWADSDERRRALPLIVDGARVGTVLVPRDAEPAVLEALQDRVVPALETLVVAARKRDELETQVIETKALRRSNVVKTAVLRSVSHDLRSPLTAITTAAGGLTSDTLSPESREELTSVIVLESVRLSRLVDNLLDLSRLQAGGVESNADWISLEEILRAAIETVAPPPGGFDVQVEDGTAAGPSRRRAARARPRERARERRALRGGRARDRARAKLRRAADAAHRRPRAWNRARGARARLRALSLRGRVRREPVSAWRSRAASWRQTAGGSEPSRCPDRAPPS